MQVRKLSLDLLLVNRANDRHGELENETAAIAWLFSNREVHMRKLAQDICEQGEIYELPLVSPEGSKFLVFDGNRRITCLKLLKDPKRAPTVELQRNFEELRRSWRGEFPEEVTCQVEADRDRIDEILFRRHTGSQGGIGQSTWDDRMKANFIARTGKGSKNNIADEIEARLASAELLPPRRKIPRSTLSRLLSAEPLRRRVGISLSDGKFTFTHRSEASLKALARIVDDLSSRKVVLGDIWDFDGKTQYLDRLEKEGILPAEVDRLTTEGEIPVKARKGHRNRNHSTLRPTKRTTLIPQKEFEIVWPGRLQRHHQIWLELQYHLKLDIHLNAIAVLMRVLLELAIENYISQEKVEVHSNDKLSQRIQKVAAHMRSRNVIDDKYVGELKKFQHSEKIVSADTLNRYVHSPAFAPSPEHMTANWDTLAPLVVQCLKA